MNPHEVDKCTAESRHLALESMQRQECPACGAGINTPSQCCYCGWRRWVGEDAGLLSLKSIDAWWNDLPLADRREVITRATREANFAPVPDEYLDQSYTGLNAKLRPVVHYSYHWLVGRMRTVPLADGCTISTTHTAKLTQITVPEEGDLQLDLDAL